jgi:hypothetical protein
MKYNPVVRNFNRIRRVLMQTMALPREAIRPSSTFAELVPRCQRQRVWARLHQEKLEIDPLFFSRDDLFIVAVAILGSFVVFQVFWPMVFCWPAVISLTIGNVVACLLYLYWTDEVDPTYTVGDAALGMTTPEQCHDAEYRLNRKEIFLKVRRVLAYVTGTQPDEIRPSTKLIDILDE